MPKPMLRLECALLHEDLMAMTEEEYATVVLHQLWEIETNARKYGFDLCAGAVAMARLELMPVFQATQPGSGKASRIPDFVKYDKQQNKIEMNLPVV